MSSSLQILWIFFSHLKMWKPFLTQRLHNEQWLLSKNHIVKWHVGAKLHFFCFKFFRLWKALNVNGTGLKDLNYRNCNVCFGYLKCCIKCKLRHQVSQESKTGSQFLSIISRTGYWTHNLGQARQSLYHRTASLASGSVFSSSQWRCLSESYFRWQS